MAVVFRNASYPPLDGLNAHAPDGAVIGVIGEDGSGKQAALRLAAGDAQPLSGEVVSDEPRRLIRIGDPLNFAPVRTLALEYALARNDALVRARTLVSLDRLRKTGATILLCSHEPDLLRLFADEVWWLDRGRLAAAGDPREILGQYQSHIAQRLTEWGRTIRQQLSPSLRRGDGRAELESIETLDGSGAPSMVWQAGEEAAVRVIVKFAGDVEDPVVGMLIRTRIGFEVFGTNTELENVQLGQRRAGDRLRITFRFRCELCPQDYTVTAASHDPDGTWHDWMEDALAVTVADSRQTAGVARLNARVEVEES